MLFSNKISFFMRCVFITFKCCTNFPWLPNVISTLILTCLLLFKWDYLISQTKRRFLKNSVYAYNFLQIRYLINQKYGVCSYCDHETFYYFNSEEICASENCIGLCTRVKFALTAMSMFASMKIIWSLGDMCFNIIKIWI